MASSDVITDPLWLLSNGVGCICGSAGVTEFTKPGVAPTYQQMMRIRRTCLEKPATYVVNPETIEIDSGGSGYSVGDVIQTPDGALFVVSSVSANSITGVNLLFSPQVARDKTSLDPVSTTALYKANGSISSLGSGASLTLTWQQKSGCCTC